MKHTSEFLTCGVDAERTFDLTALLVKNISGLTALVKGTSDLTWLIAHRCECEAR